MAQKIIFFRIQLLKYSNKCSNLLLVKEDWEFSLFLNLNTYQDFLLIIKFTKVLCSPHNTSVIIKTAIKRIILTNKSIRTEEKKLPAI